MRQGDGADLLGSNDSRSESIGVIYVDPSDDRQRVLTSILTLDKLTRKQVVVVLPEHNKAFQQSADFDGLKNMRRGLKSEIVFVAPGSPAEFARQRRFPTYSSLESFAQSLKEEVLVNGTPNRGIFGFIRKPKQADANVMPTATPRPRITNKFRLSLSESLPAVAIAGGLAMQSNGSDAAPTGQQGDSEKIAALGAGAGVANRTAASGGGGPPPGGSSPGGPGGGGGGVGGSRGRTRLLLAILLIVLTVMLLAGIAIAAVPGGLNSIVKVFPGATTTATVTITPTSKDLANTYVITGVTGHPDPTKRQVQARILTYTTTPPQKTTANATGSIPGRKATGQLTFYNGAVTTGQTVVAGTIFTAAHGVRVVNDVDANIPKANPPIFGSVTVPAHALNAGVSGNISAGDANQAISTTITVKNLSAFSGGQNAVPNTVIQQSDINGAAEPILKELTSEAKAAVQKQVKPNEQLVPSTLKCTNIVTADPKAGAIAKTSTVTVAVTCTEEVYDHQGATTMAQSLLTQEAVKEIGPDYKLTGNIVTSVTQATVVDTKGTVSLLVRAEGVWVYKFSDLANIAKNIAKKSKQDAEGYLKCLPGYQVCLRDLDGRPVVSSVQIDISSGNILPDVSGITIIIKSVPGATGTPTGSPTSTGSPTRKATPTITPTPGLGGS